MFPSVLATQILLVMVLACNFGAGSTPGTPVATGDAVPIPTTAEATQPVSSGAVYYVRPDGGSGEQCTGLVDTPYPGSGSSHLPGSSFRARRAYLGRRYAILRQAFPDSPPADCDAAARTTVTCRRSGRPSRTSDRILGPAGTRDAAIRQIEVGRPFIGEPYDSAHRISCRCDHSSAWKYSRFGLRT
jgi:hypothetical protein